MSSNDEIIIVERNDKFFVFINGCVDNDYDWRKDKPHKVFNTFEEAEKFATEWEPEYGFHFEKDSKCLCCGRPTSAGIPLTICVVCSGIIAKYNEARKAMSNTFRALRDIDQITVKGDDDISFNLNCAYERIANIEEELAWMKNVLANINSQEPDLLSALKVVK